MWDEMGKDPAVLFYTSDFLTGTMFMTDEQVGQYIRLLCAQHQKGRLESDEIISIIKSYDSPVIKKFIKDKSGKYYNKRMEEEIINRENYCNSRSHKGLSGRKKRNHTKIIRKSYGNHTEDENENENININSFKIPSLIDVQNYIDEKGYDIDANKWYNFYSAKGWMIGKNKMKDWKAAVRTWLPDKNKDKGWIT